MITKYKEKILNAARDKWYLNYKGKTIPMCVDFSRTYGGHKEVTQYFSSAERKELPTQNSTSNKSDLQEFSDEGKLREFVTSKPTLQFSSVHLFSRVWLFATHGLQHARPPCPSQTPGACSNSCPSSQWCHSTISSFVVPFSSCLQSFPTSESFPVSQFFTSGSQSIGVSASTSVPPMNTQGWYPLGWTGHTYVCMYMSFYLDRYVVRCM